MKGSGRQGTGSACRAHPGVVPRPALGLACLLAVASAVGPERARASADTARASLERKDYPAARSEYERLLGGRPDDARLAYNAGVAAFRQQDYEGAARHFESVLGSPDLRLQERAYFNLGNTRVRQGEAASDPADRKRLWEDAERLYGAALGLDPADADAKANLDTTRQLVASLPKPPPQSQDPQQSKKDDKQQDGKKPEEKQEGQDGGQKQDDPSKSQQQQQQQKSQQGEKGGNEEGKQEPSRPEAKKSPEQQGKDKEKDKGSKGESQGKKDGKDAGEQPGKEGRPQPGQGAREGEGQEGAAEPETPEGMMAVKFAERLLDSHKAEERALIWRPPGTGREAGDMRGRRKTW